MAELELSLISNTRAVQQEFGTEVPESIERMSDALDGVAQGGDDASDTLQSGFREILDGAGEAAEGIDEVSDSSENASLSVRSIGKAAKEAVEGDFTSAITAATGFLRNFGPVGVIAGGIAAGGIGIVKSVFDANTEAAKADAQEAAKWAEAWIAAGGDVITAQQITAEVLSISTDPAKYEQAKNNAADWGVTVSTAMRAMAGDAGALTVAQRSLNDRSAEATRLLAEQEEETNANAAAAYALDDAVNRGTESIQGLYAGMQAGREIAGNTSDALKEIVQSAESASLEVDALGNQLYTLPDGQKIVIDAETGQASQDVSTFKGDLDGIPETVNPKVTLVIDDSAIERALAKPRTMKVTIEGSSRTGQRLI